jgi:hypothetical protein
LHLPAIPGVHRERRLLMFAVMAFNLTRAAATLTGTGLARPCVAH